MKKVLKLLLWYFIIGAFLLAIDISLFLKFLIIFVLVPILYFFDTWDNPFSDKPPKEKNDNVGKKFIDHM